MREKNLLRNVDIGEKKAKIERASGYIVGFAGNGWRCERSERARQLVANPQNTIFLQFQMFSNGRCRIFSSVFFRRGMATNVCFSP